MIVVLDTNVIVSGLLKGDSPPGRILDLCLDGAIGAAYNAKMLSEYQEVLRRPHFQFYRQGWAEVVLRRIEATWLLVVSEPLSRHLPDPADESFLEVALAVPADALITGNLRHFPVSARQGIPVVGPAEFLSRLHKTR